MASICIHVYVIQRAGKCWDIPLENGARESARRFYYVLPLEVTSRDVSSTYVYVVDRYAHPKDFNRASIDFTTFLDFLGLW